MINHSSVQHPWFVESARDPEGDRRDWYVWRDDDPGWTQPWGGTYPVWHKRGEHYYYGIFWSGRPHAGAFKTLATDEAKAIATEKRLGDPQQAAECLKCHVTAADAPAEAFAAKFKASDKSADHHVDGVGCEACHGAGSKYKSAKVMKAITGGTTDGATVGLVNAADEALCRKCHNEESPTFKGFDFAEYAAKIAHPIPEAHKATYQK